MEGAGERKFSDYMGCANDAAILAFLDTSKDEKIIFSCSVTKYNRWNMA